MIDFIKKNKSLLLIFIIFLIFYLTAHPITIFDADDWLYISFHRQAIPMPGLWNPARVFPEISMQLLSLFASKIIFPINNDFIKSLSIIYAIAVSASITFLSYWLKRYFEETYKCNKYYISSLLLFFFVCLFLMFKHGTGNWDYLLSTNDACTYFYYVIPNLLNCSLVLMMELDNDIKDLFSNNKIVKKSLFVLLIYYCIFSNLFPSIILASYCGTIILLDLIKQIKNNDFKIFNYIKTHSTYLIIIVMWLVSNLLEMAGGRAEQIGSNSFFNDILASFNILINKFKSINYMVLFILIIIILIGCICIFRNNKEDFNIINKLLLSSVIFIVYDALLCAKAGAHYLSRSDVLFGLFFFLLMIVLICLKNIFDSFYLVKIICPLLLSILIISCNSRFIAYRYSTMGNLSESKCYEIDQDIINQFIEADVNDQKEMKLYVIDYNNDSNNFPMATYIGERISVALHKYGVIENEIEVEVVPTIEKNKQFGVNITNE